MATITTTLKLVDKMTGTLADIETKIGNISTKLGLLDQDIDDSQDKLNNFSYDGFSGICGEIGLMLNNLGDTMTAVFTIPGALLGGKMYSAASDYEAAFTGVVKTTGKSREQLDAEYVALLNITENMPIENGFVQAATTMQSAAQYGARSYEELIGFTESYEKAVKSTDIQGITGSEEIAQFLNIMDGDVSNVDRYLSTVVELGNSFATGENAIQQTALRIARTGALAEYTTPQIAALAAAISTLGLEPQAGGSAAARMIKEMQGAAEIGMQAYELFGDKYGNAAELSYFVSTKDNMLTVAQELGTTTDYVQSMLDAWLDLENFAEISGKTADQFAADWASNPAQSMLDFFSGIARMDESGIESAIAVLERIGITEIRQSDMVAALTGRSEIFASALELAEQAYEENTALYEEYAIFADTQASRDIMLKNKAMNTAADFGENVQDAVQPFINYANSLLDIFNAMDEADQDKVVKIMGALIISGPAAKIMGNVATTFSTIASALGKIGGVSGLVTKMESLGGFALTLASSPVGIVAGGLAFAAAISSIPTELDALSKEAMNIEFSFNQSSIDAAIAQIQSVRDSLDLLNADVVNEMEGYTAAVSLGYGDESMFRNALAYESAAVNDAVNQVYANYAPRLKELERAMSDAGNAGDVERLAVIEAEKMAVEAEMLSEIGALQKGYSAILSDLFGGIIYNLRGEESYAALEKAAQAYRLEQAAAAVWEADSSGRLDARFGTGAEAEAAMAQWDALNREMYALAYAMPELADMWNGKTLDEIMQEFISGGRTDWLSMDIQSRASQMLVDAMRLFEEDEYLSNLLFGMLQDSEIYKNLDVSTIDGAFAGAMAVIDFKGAVERSGHIEEAGTYLTEGLAMGAESEPALARIGNAAYAVFDNFLQNFRIAAGISSPARNMIPYGVYLPAGIAEGVRMGETMLTAAIDAVCNAGIASAALIMNYDSGYAVGAAFGRGMVQGIRSMYSSVAAAARAVANAGASAARSALDINSPSGVTEEIGRYFGEGFEIGILRSVKSVESAAGLLADSAWSEMELNDEDAKRIRSLAEREVINRFTTAELHIDFTAQNNINSDMDLDGVVSYLEEQVAERLQMAAEGVYN